MSELFCLDKELTKDSAAVILNEKGHSSNFVSTDKRITQRGQKQYRLLRKSPLKTSPTKNLAPIFRMHKRNSLNKTKITSPRKLQFILPKVKVIRPRHKMPAMQRILKAKPVPENENGIMQKEEREKHQRVPEIIRPPNPSNLDEEQILENDQQQLYDHNDNEEDVDDLDQQLQEEHLAAFLKASSTIAFQRGGEKKCNSNSRQKLNKHQRRLQEKISALSYIPNLNSHQNALVINYIVKVKEALNSIDKNKFNEFVVLLKDFACSSNSPEKVYFEVCKILKDFPELQEEFVMFMQPDQAIRIGKFTEYSTIIRLREFADELKHHFARQPQNFQKFVKTLQILHSKSNLTSKEFIDGFTPILRLQPQILESLSHCIPSEPPQESIADEFEEINLDKPGSPDSVEEINLIDDEIKISSDSCLCNCHSTFNAVPSCNSAGHPQNKSEHCMSCKIRFIDGRVYVQCGKALRPAKVVYMSSATTGKKEEILSSFNHSSDQTVPSTSKIREDKCNRKYNNKISGDKLSKQGKGISKLPDSSDAEKPRKRRKSRKLFN